MFRGSGFRGLGFRGLGVQRGGVQGLGLMLLAARIPLQNLMTGRFSLLA